MADAAARGGAAKRGADDGQCGALSEEQRRALVAHAGARATCRNHAGAYARKLLHGEMAMTDAALWQDYQLLVAGEAIYLKGFLCGDKDFALLRSLMADMAAAEGGRGMVNWSKHQKHENPSFSPTFHCIVDAMAAYFDVDVFATRLNYYPDNSSWKPYHHDSHAYCDGKGKEDFTMGASFGHCRELAFLHPPSERVFSFPQQNGDIFAFTTNVNRQYQHGVPKACGKSGPRFSVIAWGRRRTLNERNASQIEPGFGCAAPAPDALRLSGENMRSPADGAPPSAGAALEASPAAAGEAIDEARNEQGSDIAEVAAHVDEFIEREGGGAGERKGRAKKKGSERRQRGRVQGGWSKAGGAPKKSGAAKRGGRVY